MQFPKVEILAPLKLDDVVILTIAEIVDVVLIFPDAYIKSYVVALVPGSDLT